MAQKLLGYQVAVRLTSSEKEEIQRLVESGIYRSVADFCRDAIRDKLRQSEVISLRNASLKEAETMVTQYLSKSSGSHYVSEIAEKLGLEYSTVFKAVSTLLSRGKIRRASI